MELDPSVAAVVTGGATGLGAATVRALAAKGAKVAIFERDAERGQALASELGVTFCQVDVTSDDSIAAAFAAARVPTEYALLASAMIENGYINGEDVRIDGAIRMAPR